MITKKCLFCDTDFEYKRDSAKFCSDNCRVKWNYANRKDKENRSTKIGAQALLNQAMDILADVKGRLGAIGSIQPQISPQKENMAVDEPFTYKPSIKAALRRSVSSWIEWRRDISDEEEFEKWKKEYAEAEYLTKRDRITIDNNH